MRWAIGVVGGAAVSPCVRGLVTVEAHRWRKKVRPSGAPDAHAWGARARMRSEWAIEKRMGNRRGRAREVVREEGEIFGETACEHLVECELTDKNCQSTHRSWYHFWDESFQIEYFSVIRFGD